MIHVLVNCYFIAAAACFWLWVASIVKDSGDGRCALLQHLQGKQWCGLSFRQGVMAHCLTRLWHKLLPPGHGCCMTLAGLEAGSALLQLFVG